MNGGGKEGGEGRGGRTRGGLGVVQNPWLQAWRACGLVIVGGRVSPSTVLPCGCYNCSHANQLCVAAPPHSLSHALGRPINLIRRVGRRNLAEPACTQSEFAARGKGTGRAMSRVIEAATLFAVGALAGGVIVYGTRRTAPPPPPPPPAVQDVVSGEIMRDGCSPGLLGC
jgi:hypothetical protein